jgi:hypothetical protein
MKVKLTTEITELNGDRIWLEPEILEHQEPDAAKRKKKNDARIFMNVRQAIQTAMFYSKPGEEQLAETKNKFYRLSKKLYGSNEADFTESEIEIIKEQAAANPNTPFVVYGQLMEVLEPKEK